MSHKNTAEAKDRPISEKQWSTDTSPQFTESSTITSQPFPFDWSHTFPKSQETDTANDLHLSISLPYCCLSPSLICRPVPGQWVTQPSILSTCVHMLAPVDFSQWLHGHITILWTAQSSRASTAWQLRPSHGLLWIAYPKYHCFTVPGVAIASTRLQSHSDLLNPTWIWERLYLGWCGEWVKALG